MKVKQTPQTTILIVLLASLMNIKAYFYSIHEDLQLKSPFYGTLTRSIKLGNMIIGFVTLLVGITLTPTVATTVTSQFVNLTGASATVGALVPLFWVLSVISVAVAIMWEGFKDVM